MINVQEHIYDDDPTKGHPDVRTRLENVSYFFLGNGHIQAAIQYAPAGTGTPIGLVIMNPDQLVKKRETLSFDDKTGFEATMLQLRKNGEFVEIPAQQISAQWCFDDNQVPAVRLQWNANDIQVKEAFYCPDRSNPLLIREITIKNISKDTVNLKLKTGIRSKAIEKDFDLSSSKDIKLFIHYKLINDATQVAINFSERAFPLDEAINYWKSAAKLHFSEPLLERYFQASNFQLPGVTSKNAKVDASIWQYNREWVRDHSFMALGLILSGHHKLAGVLLERLLNEFVSNEGDCVDSSEIRDPEDVELDQNGTLLYVLKNYAIWTGDLDLIERNWEKIEKTANYPFKDVFQHHASGMFCNSREFWERHKIFGIENGIELTYQFFPAIGLAAAAVLARMLSYKDEARIWDQQAKNLKNAILNHPQFALIDKRGFIKRRSVNGEVQETITPLSGHGLPDGVPLTEMIDHFLNPDTSSALPIVHGFVPTDSWITKATMEQIEFLWNQDWQNGGYGRYHANSEADSKGAWPFPSLFVARAYMETGDYDKVWRILNWLNTIPGSISGSWFEFYGNRLSPPFPQVGITPWTWGEMIVLIVHHLMGIQPEEHFIRFRPRFIPGLDHISGSLPFRNHRIHLNLNVDPFQSNYKLSINIDGVEINEKELIIPYTHINKDIFIEGSVPKNIT